jgi:hypothetical protein
MDILLYSVIGVVGILCVALTIQMVIGIIFVIKLRSYGILTEARVIDTYTSYYRIPYKTPTIEYEANGRIIQKKMHEQGLIKPWKIGDKIMIKFDPNNEEKCYILVNSILYYITGLLVSLLFAIVCNGLVISTLF